MEAEQVYYIPGDPSTNTDGLDDDQIKKIQSRDWELTNLFSMYEKIANKLTGETKAEALGRVNEDGTQLILDLDTSNEIAGCISTIFSAMRKEDNKQGAGSELLGQEVSIDGKVFKIKELYDELLVTNKPKSFAVATPIMNTLTAFKLFFDEVRMGVTKFTIRSDLAQKRGTKRSATGVVIKAKKDDPSRQVNISQYGLNANHIPLLQGITLPPERKTGLVKSLGVMTQAITLINESNFKNKTMTALEHSLAMLDIHPGIIGCLADASDPGYTAGMLGDLGDLLVLTTARCTQKIYFPMNVYRLLWMNRGSNFQWNFASPHLMALFTSKVLVGGFRFKMRCTGPSSLAAQAVFHAIFGTYLDDLSLLPQITNHGDWVKRPKMNDMFKQRTKAQKITFQPIVLTKVAKMSQTLMTRSLGNVQECLFTRPSFSGATTRTISQKMKDYLNTGNSGTQYSKDPSTLRSALREKKDKVMKALAQKEVELIGTRKWLVINGNSLAETDEVMKSECKSFF